jgi:hypothetical protein
MLNYPFLKATVKAVSLLAETLNVGGLIMRLGMMTPSFTESFYLCQVAPFAENVLTMISSSLAILLGLNSLSKHWM